MFTKDNWQWNHLFNQIMNRLEHSLRTHFGIHQPALLAKLTTLFEPVQLKKGDFFLKAHEACNQLSFIEEGLFRFFAGTKTHEVTQWIASPGYFITDLSGFIFDTPARWTIQALSDAHIYTIRKSKYKEIPLFVPEWSTLEKQFIIHCFNTLENRVFSHLSMSAEERYLSFFQQHKELFNQVPLQYIASMLGMTPETFSRIRKKTLS